MLGNLILIDRSANAQAGSLDFTQKVDLYRRMNPPFAMAREVAFRTTWTKEDILERTARMQAFSREQLMWEDIATPPKDTATEEADQ